MADFGFADFCLFDLGAVADLGFLMSLFGLAILSTDDLEDFDLLFAAEAPTVDLDIFDVRLASPAIESFEKPDLDLDLEDATERDAEADAADEEE